MKIFFYTVKISDPAYKFSYQIRKLNEVQMAERKRKEVERQGAWK
jgi:hypothetical protein